MVVCFSGVYELQLKAFVSRAVISGPQLLVSIQPDATKPVSFNISYKPQDTYTVGALLPGSAEMLLACVWILASAINFYSSASGHHINSWQYFVVFRLVTLHSSNALSEINELTLW